MALTKPLGLRDPFARDDHQKNPFVLQSSVDVLYPDLVVTSDLAPHV